MLNWYSRVLASSQQTLVHRELPVSLGTSLALLAAPAVRRSVPLCAALYCNESIKGYLSALLILEAEFYKYIVDLWEHLPLLSSYRNAVSPHCSTGSAPPNNGISSLYLCLFSRYSPSDLWWNKLYNRNTRMVFWPSSTTWRLSYRTTEHCQGQHLVQPLSFFWWKILGLSQRGSCSGLSWWICSARRILQCGMYHCDCRYLHGFDCTAP